MRDCLHIICIAGPAEQDQVFEPGISFQAEEKTIKTADGLVPLSPSVISSPQKKFMPEKSLDHGWEENHNRQTDDRHFRVTGGDAINQSGAEKDKYPNKIQDVMLCDVFQLMFIL